MKRILTVQDISCVGKCSLTVALPIISAMGVEACVLPTAVLSTHTMFKNFTYRDLTSDIKGIERHWKDENITFDAIYTGYLGSFEQLELVKGLFETFGTDKNKIIIDPVMADNGKLYPGFTNEFAGSMAKLCSHADVIMPNLTEASFMLGIPYVASGYTEDDIKKELKALCALGTKTAVLTGVSFEAGKLGVMSYDSGKDEYFSYFREHLPASYHGTGDIFASAFTGACTLGKSVSEALKVAVDYTVNCIAKTLEDPDRRTYGVNFEAAIPELINSVK